MANDPTRIPSKPKLRTSCDQCGAAKVRCDRNQPECGRCVSHGWACVYGVSRKMGKPPRGKHRQGSFKRSSSSIPGTGDGSKLEGGSSSDAWDVNCIGLDASDSLLGDLNRAYLPSSPPLDFGEWALTEQFSEGPPFAPMLTPESLGSYPPTEASTAHPTAHQSPADSTLVPTVTVDGHDCFREAHDILRNLSFEINEAHFASASGSSSVSATGSIANQVPLDHVLRLNCEARERLGPLLTCSCARSPHLALVYAAIISRVLMWYQEASGYTQSASWSQALADSALSMSDARSAVAAIAQSTAGIAVAPAKMAIGTFSVDDLGIQAALKMQLLAGEMKRTGCLIDQFTSLNSGGDESNFDSVDKLYQSLHLWLRGEHSRIASMMRLKLRELNT